MGYPPWKLCPSGWSSRHPTCGPQTSVWRACAVQSPDQPELPVARLANLFATNIEKKNTSGTNLIQLAIATIAPSQGTFSRLIFNQLVHLWNCGLWVHGCPNPLSAGDPPRWSELQILGRWGATSRNSLIFHNRFASSRMPSPLSSLGNIFRNIFLIISLIKYVC